MAELLKINPARRKTRKRRTAAQKAATRKLVAANRRRGGSRKRRRNPTPSNAHGVARYKRRSLARRRNPTVRGVMRSTVHPAIMGATGALVLDIAWGSLPIPMTLKTGYMRHAVKAGGALGLGMLAGMVTTRANAEQLARGAMTVVAHGAMRELAQQFMPQVPLDGMSYYSAGLPVGVDGMDAYVNGMGAYVSSEGATDPYLAADTLAKPFAGPSAAAMATQTCIENEKSLNGYF